MQREGARRKNSKTKSNSTSKLFLGVGVRRLHWDTAHGVRGGLLNVYFILSIRFCEAKLEEAVIQGRVQT